MSPNNVVIKVFDQDELVEVREIHNVWVYRAREYLANMLGYSSHDPDVPEETARLKYLGVGIGGIEQQALGAVGSPPLSTSYPADGDSLRPGTTSDGHQYDHRNPRWVPITTLERPVRITGGSNSYGSASPTDQWLVQPPDLFTTHMSLNDVTVHAVVDGSAGDIIYSPFTVVPLSEAGLFIDESAVDPSDGEAPFKPLVAYVTFATISMTSTSRLEFIWTVRFN